MEALHTAIAQRLEREEWEQLDKALKEVELLVNDIPGFKHTSLYEECSKLRINSFSARKDKKQLIKAAAIYKKIEFL